MACFRKRRPRKKSSNFRKRRPYPAVQLWWKFGLELTDGSITIVSLDEDLGGQ